MAAFNYMLKTVAAPISILAAVIGALSAVGSASETVRDAISFLWPVGLICLLTFVAIAEGWLLWRCQRLQATNNAQKRLDTADGETGSPSAAATADGLASNREKEEAAYRAILAAVEPYINAHLTEASLLADVENVYIPDLREAEAAVERVNQHFVAARQQIEQHGTKTVFDATLAIEDAVNNGDLEKASQLRRDQLVPAIRQEMSRPTSASWQ